VTGARPVVVGVTGASGAIYAERLLKALLENGHAVELVISVHGARLFKEERDLPGTPRDLVTGLRERYGPALEAGSVVGHGNADVGASIASGSYPTRGMVIVPASMKTLGAVASGNGHTLIDRAAAVTLKERRPLVVVPRETPFGRIELRNMLRLHDAGAVILAANPGFYLRPRTFEDLADAIVTRILDHLGIAPGTDLVPRWNPRHP
jgi:4-hydroxy-3-polyprenylbenzoate decarboxylase